MADPVRNIGASVRARLQNLARTTGQPFETLLVRYGLERLLYRLSRAEHSDRFVLKGAMLLMTWLASRQRILELVAVAVSVLVVALFVKRLDGNVVILIATVSAATLATVLLRRKNTANEDGTP